MFKNCGTLNKKKMEQLKCEFFSYKPTVVLTRGFGFLGSKSVYSKDLELDPE